METWGYEDEDQAAANLWGHGLGLAQYDPPVISRIWSLDHPIEIKDSASMAEQRRRDMPSRAFAPLFPLCPICLLLPRY